MTEALDQILLCPGLYWIGELIFVEFLDSDDVFANCELVCKKWQQFFITYSKSLEKTNILQNCKSWKLSEILTCQVSRVDRYLFIDNSRGTKYIISSFGFQIFEEI